MEPDGSNAGFKRDHYEDWKHNYSISDTAWRGLVDMAVEYGYVGSNAADFRPVGMSAFLTTLAALSYRDARPEYLRDTDQWHTGMEPMKKRLLRGLTPRAVAGFGAHALEFNIWPFRTQAPVVNGFRQRVDPPVLHPDGEAPQGSRTARALVAPVLEAIGLRWLVPTEPIPPNPKPRLNADANHHRRLSRQRAINESLSW